MLRFTPLSIVLLLLPSGVLAADACLQFRGADVPPDSKSQTVRALQAEVLPNGGGLNPRRGTIITRLQVKGPVEGFPAHVEMYPGPPHMVFRCVARWPADAKGKIVSRETLECGAAIELRSELESFQSATISLKPGSDLHVAWTWSGVEHRIYLNGALVTTYVAKSAFPPEFASPLRVLSNNPNQVDGPIHEIALYDFTMSPQQVAADVRQKDAKPMQPEGTQGPHVVAQWAPAERRVYVAADSGNPLAPRAAKYRLEMLGPGEAVIAKAEMPAAGGFAQLVHDLPPLSPGTYRVKAAVVDEGGKELATVNSEPWKLPEAPWLRNELGITDKVQPPWTPMTVEGTTIGVWGRQLRLAGGFGLPQQIVSQGRELLKAPVTLQITRAGQDEGLTASNLEIIEAKPHIVRWHGEAQARDFTVSVDGTQEYDGMILLKVTLAPKPGAAGAKIDAMHLRTIVPDQRALFMNASTDQGYWWYPCRGPVPRQPGVIHDNLKQKSGKTRFLFFTMLFDHDTGLEWFADNLSGWQVDESKPMQQIIRQQSGDVEFACHLANQPFTLSAPITITFGYAATPMKPLPQDWRTLYVHHHRMKLASDLGLWWIWSNDALDKLRPNIFQLLPNDTAGYARANIAEVKRAPFTNQHVLVPSYPDNQGPGRGWTLLNQVLQAETENDGWNAVPTRGLRDYWAWNIDQWLKAGGMEAIYIDEANYATVGGALLSGAGYLKPDGTTAFGHNTLGMRQQLKRVRQLYIDNGKRPLVWLPVYGSYIPHVFAFADIVSEGEAYMFEDPRGPTWIDVWGRGLTGPPSDAGFATGGPWLLSLGPAQKFGSIPVFLNYIKYYDKPQYRPALRAQYGLLGLLDIIPIASELGWFYKAKEDFGVAAKETTFHRYFEQKEITADRDDVKISYYRRGNRVLAIVTNLGKTAFDGTVNLNLERLGLRPDSAKATLLDEKVPEPQNTDVRTEELRLGEGGSLKLSIPSHDFRMFRLE